MGTATMFPEICITISPLTHIYQIGGMWYVHTSESDGTQERSSRQGYKSFEAARNAYVTGQVEWDYGMM